MIVKHCEFVRSLKRGEDYFNQGLPEIAIVGKSNVGKSSLIRAIQGRMPHDGLVEWGEHVKIGYFEQENAQLNLCLLYTSRCV